MARTYTLIDSTWRPRTLTRFLREWASQAQPQILEPVTGQQGIGSLQAHFFAEGSLRGVELDMRARPLRTGAIDITLGTLANLTDWILGFSLLRALHEQGKGTVSDPDGAQLSIEKLTLHEAEAEGSAALRDSAKQIKQELGGRGRPWAALRSPRYDLFVVPGDLPTEPDDVAFARALAERLVPRARRYHVARPLEVMQAGDGTAFAIWHFEDALIDALPHLAVSRDVSEGAFVLRWNEVVGLLGDRMEVVATNGRRYFLPALTPGRADDDALIEKLVQVGTDVETFLQSHVMQIG